MKSMKLIVCIAAILGLSRADRWITPDDSWVISADERGWVRSWASRCVTDDDRKTVEAKCRTFVDTSRLSSSNSHTFVEHCVQKYCDMVEVRSDCGKNCEATTFPGTRDECEANNVKVQGDEYIPCKHYRLGWRLDGSDDIEWWWGEASLVPRLLKLQGERSGETKWLLLPYLGFWSCVVPYPCNYPGVSMEYQETDLWLPDLGLIQEAWLYFDTTGKYSKLKESASSFHASYLRVIPMGEDLVTDIGFLGACESGSACKAATVSTRRKWYDLVNPSPVCKGGERVVDGQSMGTSPVLCDWWREDFYYGNFVPSWRERREMVIVNAIRTDAKKAISDFFDMTEEEVVDFFHQCKFPGIVKDGWIPPAYISARLSPDPRATSNTSYWAPPLYYNLPASEGTRLKAYELAKNTTIHSGQGFNGTDIYSRVLAHTGTYCHLEDGCGEEWDGHEYGVTVAAAGGQKTSGAGAVGAVGEAPFLENCDNYRALMDPDRTMAAVGVYPSNDWDIDNPTEGYTAPVHMFFGDHSTNPFSKTYFFTYQPIPSGTHLLIDNDPGKIRFMAQYHIESGMEADSFEVVVDGVAHTLEYFSGHKSARGTGLTTYTVNVEFPYGSDYGCLSYYFRATNARGNFTLPQSGKYVFRTYGWKGCVEPHAPAVEEDGDFGASCGYPGRRCPPTKSECEEANYMTPMDNCVNRDGHERKECEEVAYERLYMEGCLNFGCSVELESGACALRKSDDDDNTSSAGSRFSIFASLMGSLIVALM